MMNSSASSSASLEEVALIGPAEDVYQVLLQHLVAPLLPLKSSGKQIPSISQQQDVAKQVFFVCPFLIFLLTSFSVWITCIRLEGCKCEYDIKKTPHRIWNENALPKIGSIREIRRFSILFIYLFIFLWQEEFLKL